MSSDNEELTSVPEEVRSSDCGTDIAEDTAILISNLSKCFQIYEKPSDRLLQMLSRGSKKYYREFWALKGISFEVKKGETIGIVGRNGSGKSTLLQLICGTLNSSGGSIQVSGRIAALLELGSGFNPEFTGRENVYMNAAILGLKKEEIDSRYAEIESFAEIGQFIDQPVKTYSSGMAVRLAFAVAINSDPEILIVDEALSVGDELFQRKCFSRIEAIKKNGATILFVSHSGATVVGLCDRAVLIDQGELLSSGTPKEIVGKYQKLLYAPTHKQQSIRADLRVDLSRAVNEEGSIVGIDQPEEYFDPDLVPKSTLAYESQGAHISDVHILTLAGEKINCLRRGIEYRYFYRVKFQKTATLVRFGMLIKSGMGIELGGSASAPTAEQCISYVNSGAQFDVEFKFKCMLNSGTYFLNAGVQGATDADQIFLHRILDVCMFRVLPETDNLATGMVDFSCYPSWSEATSHEDKVSV
ncbi:ABC transporter ATP-binding protein [Pseudomonas sp. P7]|nr:ABC transporter ATP-binding protein [Pseudomonas sivasensis]MBA2923310.1 ABC transporter ATP-binding protein [Pseudomonas sivasensis]